jgi:hypothetical protein
VLLDDAGRSALAGLIALLDIAVPFAFNDDTKPIRIQLQLLVIEKIFARYLLSKIRLSSLIFSIFLNEPSAKLS